jgi:vacuolar-type H+-ATPase catalytic subunit A/Vma1
VLARDWFEGLSVADSTKQDGESPLGDDAVEQLARELAERLREMPNRQELTDYAVSILKESNEDAGQIEQAEHSRSTAGKRDPFNPIAFGIPLLVIGAVLCATGILAGPGLGVVAIALLMVFWGLVVSLFSRSKPRKDKT